MQNVYSHWLDLLFSFSRLSSENNIDSEFMSQSQQTFTCSKSTTEIPENEKKYVQS